jgi:hypothetical protein
VDETRPIEAPLDPNAVGQKAPFGTAVSEWMRVLRALQKDATFARAVERNPVLRTIALRRLSDVETDAVEAPDLEDLTKVKTTHGEVLWMLGARHACDALAVRMNRDSLESPARLAGLLAEAREALCDARPMADHLAVWESHEELGPTYTRFAAAVGELEAEVARFSAIADGLFVGADLDSNRSPADRCLTEWGWVLETLRDRVASWSDAQAVVEQARGLCEGLVTRYAERASRELVRATVKTYDRLLLVARARGQASNEEDLCRAAERAHRSTREVLGRLLPPTAEEAAAERASRADEFAALEGAPCLAAALMASPRARKVAVVALLGTVALASAAYAVFVRPTLNYTTLDTKKIRKLWPEFTGGYVAQRPTGGRLFVAYLARQDQEAPTALVARMSQKVLDEMGPQGVREVLILDRNNVPIGMMQGVR